MANPVISAKSLPEMVDFLSRRRSAKVRALGEPGPTGAELETILTLAARVPDHGKLAPWRFIVLTGEGRTRAGAVLRAAWATENPDSADAKLTLESERFLRAPAVVAVISSPRESPKAPEWEQILSAGAACFNLCLAANAHGYATDWITEWYAYSESFKSGMGLAPHERFAGFIYIGTAKDQPEERERPDMTALTTRF